MHTFTGSLALLVFWCFMYVMCQLTANKYDMKLYRGPSLGL